MSQTQSLSWLFSDRVCRAHRQFLLALHPTLLRNRRCRAWHLRKRRRAVCSFLPSACDVQHECGGGLLEPSLESGDRAMPPEHMQKSVRCLCLRVQNGIPSRPERKKTPPLPSPNSFLGRGQPAPPLQCWRLRSATLEQEGNDFFAPRNLSPARLRWQPTLHRLGVRGSGTARLEGTFFSLGTDSGKMVLHCCFVVCACVTPSIVLQNVMFAERFANITLL